MSPKNNIPIGQINRTFEERATQKHAQELDMSYVDIAQYPLNPDVLRLVSENDAKNAGLIPFLEVGNDLKVAVTNPENPQIEQIQKNLEQEHYKVTLYLCSQEGLKTISKWYESAFLNKKQIQKKETFEEDTKNLEQQMDDFRGIGEKLLNLSEKEALNEVEIMAVEARASDVHLQPHENGYTLRLRVDGVLYPISEVETETAVRLINNIKYVGGMKSNIKDVPQDGHLSFMANSRKIDVRISTLPAEFGESLVLRILDSARGIKTLEELGLGDYLMSKMKSILLEKTGMVLITGPTGSGKTTTLYSMLAQLNKPETKIITLEDPVEYHLDGITQSQVNESRGYTFETGLRSLLRHDPDVMLIGEIRDQETAHLAVEASLTGHVVLSSLHTNSAIGSLSRLRNLGLEGYNIASSLNATLAQRLVRVVCSQCAGKSPLNPEQNPKILEAINRIKEVLPDTSIPITVPKAQGCEHCSHTGYLNRIAIAEVVIFTPTIKEMITDGASEQEIETYLREHEGYMALFEDGILKVLQGQTTLEEVFRVSS